MPREAVPRIGSVELISIPAGDILLGEEADAHRVTLGAFAIGRFPVTAGQYGLFVRDTGQPPPPHLPDGRPHLLFADHPVVHVSWFDALAFCAWLTDQLGRACRLPTEAEWEMAARGPERLIYPWGNTYFDEKCNTWTAGGGFTSPVDAFPGGASPFGVMDMAGNVWEWCSSIARDYPYVPADGREDLADREAWRVLRGGSWYDTGWGVRAARRLGSPPSRSSQNTGFRIACEP